MKFEISAFLHPQKNEGVLKFGDWRHQTRLAFSMEGGEINFLDKEIEEEDLIPAGTDTTHDVFHAWVNTIDRIINK